MENQLKNLDDTNKDNSLSRFITAARPATILRLNFTEWTKDKMVIGIYTSIGIILLIGVIAGAISYRYRNHHRKETRAAVKSMVEGEEYTFEEMDCLCYSYRSHQYFRSLNFNEDGRTSLKRCDQCAKEEDFLELVRIAHNMTERAKIHGRSPKVDALVEKGRRLKENDKVPAYVDPFAYGEDGPQPKIEEHTCRIGTKMRKRCRGDYVDDYLKVPV